MKFYTLDTEFTFGKYDGKTVKEILELQPSYLDWCAINLDHFYISDEIIAEIKKIKPDFTITEEGKQKLADKYSTWLAAPSDYDDYDDYDNYPSARDAFDTDDQYNDWLNG